MRSFLFHGFEDDNCAKVVSESSGVWFVGVRLGMVDGSKVYASSAASLLARLAVKMSLRSFKSSFCLCSMP